MASSLLAGGAALLITGDAGATRTVGQILLVTSLVALGIFIVMYGVLAERKEKSLLFVLSLPVSTMQYMTAKVAAALIAFLIPWVVLTVTIVSLTLAADSVPNGGIPFSVAMMVFFLAGFCVLLALLLSTGSEAWAVVGILTTNFAVAVYLSTLRGLPGIAETLDGPVAVWNPTILTVLGIEVAVAVLSLGLAFLVHAKRKNFV
jgi:ABC-type transport system involved in multi-copper enzyme maturation permease subunit